MQRSSFFSDCKLRVQDVELPAHRCVLAARSSVFKAMFAHKMTESLEGVVAIDDSFSVEAVQLMLRCQSNALSDQH